MRLPRFGLYDEIVDAEAYSRTIGRFRSRGITLPTFAQLADPTTMPAGITERLGRVDPDAADPLNLWRVHWYNDATRVGRSDVPDHVVLPGELTGVDARIVVVFGNRFPMIRAHKVLAAYACLAPRVVAGAFDPTRDRAIWPSTGNYARGGVAISRIMDSRGAAVLPEGMSKERFDWLHEWTDTESDIIRTHGTESNVKEIYDACKELAQDPSNVVLNQFSEFGNHLGHYAVTGRALEHVVDHLGGGLTAYVAASGSGGTLGAGDRLKERFGARIAAVEALECPTMLYNGYGEHNIQGIGDKHIPLIHNVMNTDDAIAVSDKATDSLLLLFNTGVGHDLLLSKGVDPAVVGSLRHMGLSSICNMLASIKLAKFHGLGSSDTIITVATDGSEMYESEIDRLTLRDHPDGFGDQQAAAAHARHLEGVSTDHVLELGTVGRERIFNLGYYTWVEQQGVEFADFEARRDPRFWHGLRPYVARWDEMIASFNHSVA